MTWQSANTQLYQHLREPYSKLRHVGIKVDRLKLQQSLMGDHFPVYCIPFRHLPGNKIEYILQYKNSVHSEFSNDVENCTATIVSALNNAFNHLLRKKTASLNYQDFPISETVESYKKRLSSLDVDADTRAFLEYFQPAYPIGKNLFKIKSYVNSEKHRIGHILMAAKQAKFNLPYPFRSFPPMMVNGKALDFNNMSTRLHHGSSLILDRNVDPKWMFELTGKAEFVFGNNSSFRNEGVTNVLTGMLNQVRSVFALFEMYMNEDPVFMLILRRGDEIQIQMNGEIPDVG